MGSTSYARKPHSEVPLNHMWPAYWSSKAALNMQVGPGLAQRQLLRPKQHPLCLMRASAGREPGATQVHCLRRPALMSRVPAARPHKIAPHLHLCMQVAILSNDLLEEKFTVVALHPGWVQTGEFHRSGCDQGAHLRCS